LDTAYQLLVLHGFYIVQMLMVAVGCAVLPYVLIRSPIDRITRSLYRHRDEAANGLNAPMKTDAERRK
jgi:hypothetical protein